MKFKISDKILKLKPYEPGKSLTLIKKKYKLKKIIKLASNENPIGFSSKVLDAISLQTKNMNRYPESSCDILRKKLAAKFLVSPDNIVIGNGSDDIISLLSHGFLNLNDEAIIPQSSFSMYKINVSIAKGTPLFVPLSDFGVDLDSILKNISTKTKLVFITNPFNPTGSVIRENEFNDFLNKMPEDILIVFDEAYIEFVRDSQVFNSLKHPLRDSRVVTLRTFSKAYGLAGFRIGYGIMDKKIACVLNTIRQPFNANSLAQVAALAALEDEEFLNKSVSFVHTELDFLYQKLENLKLRYLFSHANFLMIDVKKDAEQIFHKMLKKGVIVRSMKSYGFETFLRVSAGTRKENIVFINTLSDILSEKQN